MGAKLESGDSQPPEGGTGMVPDESVKWVNHGHPDWKSGLQGTRSVFSTLESGAWGAEHRVHLEHQVLAALGGLRRRTG